MPGATRLLLRVDRHMTEPDVRILLVEDSATAAQLAEAWLREGLHCPFELSIARSLRDGLDTLASRPIDVLVLDLNLPDSEGLDTYRAIRRVQPRLATVITSSETDEAIAVEAVRAGAQDYIVKGGGTGNQLARPVRFAIERMRREQAEYSLEESNTQIQIARAVQERLYPQPDLPLQGLEAHGRCEAADNMAGDYYDYPRMADGQQGLVIGDVSGHGIGSALMMVETRAVLRLLATLQHDCGRILTRTNEVLAPDFEGFASLFLASFDPDTRRLTYASAGQPGYVLDAAGQIKVKLTSRQPPLGVLTRVRYTTAPPLQLEAGDLLVLYTDGITECRNAAGDMFGVSRLLGLVRRYCRTSLRAISDHVFQEVLNFAAVDEPDSERDDKTLVVCRVA